jgi:SAM-dependent methyltransferase
MYYSPRAYELMIRAAHHGVFQKRIEAIKSFIDSGRVLDLGCGTGLIQEYLNVPYTGLEKNPRFVSYARKRKRNVIEADIHSFKKYVANGDTTVLLVDVLHHIPNPGKLLDIIGASGVKQIVVCEPYDLDEHPLHGNSTINRLLDADGINDSTDWHDRDGLISFYEKHGATEKQEIRNAIIARIPCY